MALLCIAQNIHSQSLSATGQQYTRGKIYIDSRLPNLSLGKLIRYKETTAKLDDIYNKIIILDFWFTGCTACIAQFPKEDSLQKEFANDIQIIPVTYQSQKTVTTFLDKWEHDHGKMSLPLIVEDTLYESLFANNFSPHYTWISQDKRVIAHTSEDFITKENIRAVLRQALPIKQSILEDSTILKSGRMDEKGLYNYYQIKNTAHEE